ncbi:hypothetical protein EGI22_11900 [Lacihabitans sp. LS3-19]|uniref:hypothetical protein n=1 Tax=Lacihabitans sp. LS3-19 TaxID=2487335 RepID=UPI0020CBF9B0|nr:hypothetical protein [Lacihabitans sp. LS3-19]MCP9768619.1 hypothetical protein [Lacihabitans sp. LS3-19]
MSDIILKFWPQEEVAEIKIELIKEGLTKAKIIGGVKDFLGKPAYEPGLSINNYLEPQLDRNHYYFKDISLLISESNYGVMEGPEDFEYIDRNNVVSIEGGDGELEGWTKFCEKLKEITGDEYVGGWELL